MKGSLAGLLLGSSLLAQGESHAHGIIRKERPSSSGAVISAAIPPDGQLSAGSLAENEESDASGRVALAPLLDFPLGDNEEPWVTMAQSRALQLHSVSIIQQAKQKDGSTFSNMPAMHLASASLLAVSSVAFCIYLALQYSPWSSYVTKQVFSIRGATRKKQTPAYSERTLALSVCAVYVVVSVGIDVAIKMQATGNASVNGGYKFNPKCAVCATEGMKFILSASLFVCGNGFKLPDNYTAADIKWLLVPAVLYALNNLLVFKALGVNDAASFGIFRDTTIIWTAAIRWSVFRTPLGRIRLTGMAIILTGLFLNRLSSVVGTDHAISFMFLWVVLMTLTNATASVANEYAVKRNKALDINFQNCVLYVAGISFLCVLMLATDPKLLLPSEFFTGFTSSTFVLVTVQGGQGLLVSRLLKYADSMTKTVATCLRGPTLVLVAAMFVANSGSNAAALCCAALVATGCFVFLSQGPLA